MKSPKAAISFESVVSKSRDGLPFSWKDKDFETEEFLALLGLLNEFVIFVSTFLSLYRIKHATNNY